MAIKEIKKNIPVKNDLVKELEKEDLELVNGGTGQRPCPPRIPGTESPGGVIGYNTQDPPLYFDPADTDIPFSGRIDT